MFPFTHRIQIARPLALGCPLFTLAAWLALCPLPAHAAPARFLERVASSFGSDPLSPEHLVINRSNFYGEATTSGSGAALPGSGSPYAEAILNIGRDGGGLSGIADARVTYTFGVVGPPLPPGTPALPLLIDFLLIVEADVQATEVVNTLFASIDVGQEGGDGDRWRLDSCGLAGCLDRLVHRTLNLGFDPLGPDGVMTLVASIFARPAGGSARLRALADPYIYVDPSFPLADQYRIVVSEGVNNVPSNAPGGPSGTVPEPSTLLLLATAVGLALPLRRTGKRASSKVGPGNRAQVPAGLLETDVGRRCFCFCTETC